MNPISLNSRHMSQNQKQVPQQVRPFSVGSYFQYRAGVWSLIFLYTYSCESSSSWTQSAIFPVIMIFIYLLSRVLTPVPDKRKGSQNDVPERVVNMLSSLSAGMIFFSNHYPNCTLYNLYRTVIQKILHILGIEP